jgi:nicotinamidase-related amidase
MTVQLRLPIPAHYDRDRVGDVWRVPYQDIAANASVWAKQHQIQPAAQDQRRICLLLIDVQNTFCIPEFELFVGGRLGRGAVEDNQRICEFIYRNLNVITEIAPTLDTHTAMQIFHPIFWVNAAGEHPLPIATQITLDDIQQGVWRVNPAVAQASLGQSSLAQSSLAQTDRVDKNLLNQKAASLQNHALHYAKRLTDEGKYPLTIWPYHSMLGGIGHAVVSAVEEAIFFHCIARNSPTRFELKGSNPLTENYSVLRPEVLDGEDGGAIAHKNTALIQTLLAFDAVIVAGQAKSHCVAWTVDDLLTEIQAIDPALAQKIYLLDDCTSPVVVPGVVDFSDAAAAAYQRFAAAGMHVVKSTDEISTTIANSKSTMV